VELNLTQPLLETIFESSASPIFYFQEDFGNGGSYRCIFANSAAGNFLGLSKNYLVGKQFSELFSFDADLIHTIDNLKSELVYQGEFDFTFDEVSKRVHFSSVFTGTGFTYTLNEISHNTLSVSETIIEN